MSILSITKQDRFLNLGYILKNKIKPTLAAFISLVRVGYSVFFEQVFMRIGFMMTAIMAAKQGTDAMAAHQVGMNIMSLSFAFGDGLQSAAVALIGRSLGAKKPDLAKEYGRTCRLIGRASQYASLPFIFSAEDGCTACFSKNSISLKSVSASSMSLSSSSFSRSVRLFTWDACAVREIRFIRQLPP